MMEFADEWVFFMQIQELHKNEAVWDPEFEELVKGIRNYNIEVVLKGGTEVSGIPEDYSRGG